jgi:hypothetical protein
MGLVGLRSEVLVEIVPPRGGDGCAVQATKKCARTTSGRVRLDHLLRMDRRFFTDEALEREFLTRLQTSAEKSGLWDELATDWLCLDCELMPWSAKAHELLQKQYAPVGNAGVRALRAKSEVISRATRSFEVREQPDHQHRGQAWFCPHALVAGVNDACSPL